MSLLPAASFNQRICLQKFISTQDSFGDTRGAWRDIATVWADIRYLNGKEYLASQIEVNKASVSIRIRWRNDIEPTMRVLHGNDIYNIEAVLPDIQKRMHLDLVCSIEINRNTKRKTSQTKAWNLRKR